jgi:hypothetical protein
MGQIGADSARHQLQADTIKRGTFDPSGSIGRSVTKNQAICQENHVNLSFLGIPAELGMPATGVFLFLFLSLLLATGVGYHIGWRVATCPPSPD